MTKPAKNPLAKIRDFGANVANASSSAWRKRFPPSGAGGCSIMFAHPASHVCNFLRYSLDEILLAQSRSFFMCLFGLFGRHLLNYLTQTAGCDKKADFTHLSEKAIADEHLR